MRFWVYGTLLGFGAFNNITIKNLPKYYSYEIIFKILFFTFC